MVSAISFIKAQNVAVPGPVCNISQKQKCPVARSPQVFGTSQIQGLDFFFRFYLITGGSTPGLSSWRRLVPPAHEGWEALPEGEAVQ